LHHFHGVGNKKVSEFILVDQQLVLVLVTCPDRQAKLKEMTKSWTKCLEDGPEQLLELGGVPMLAAAADGVVADDDLPGRLGLRQRVVQIL